MPHCAHVLEGELVLASCSKEVGRIDKHIVDELEHYTHVGSSNTEEQQDERYESIYKVNVNCGIFIDTHFSPTQQCQGCG